MSRNFEGIAKSQNTCLKAKKVNPTKLKNRLAVYGVLIYRVHTYKECIMGKKEDKYRNVGILIEDHELLRELAADQDRSMVKQLSHLIKQGHAANQPEDNVYGRG